MTVAVGVVFSPGGKVYSFDPGGLELAWNEKVICQTSRGQELGRVVKANHELDASRRDAAEEGRPPRDRGRPRDCARRTARRRRRAMRVFREVIREQGVAAKPVSAELVFDGSRVVFSYEAEQRPDVARLQAELRDRLHRRVELRSVGPRECARLCGDHGLCGGEHCSRRFPSHEQPITLRMAKDQELPMSSGRITGLCGRLRCCLAFEHPLYKSFRDRAPRVGRRVETPHGQASSPATRCSRTPARSSSRRARPASTSDRRVPRGRVSPPEELERRLADYRSMRRELERAVVPLATSVDGRRFTFQASLHDLAFQAGGYVVLEDGGEPRLGQVITLEPASREGPDARGRARRRPLRRPSMLLRYAQGEGVVLEGDGAPVPRCRRPARRSRRRSRPGSSGRARSARALAVGELVLAPGVPFALDAGGFDRHTFLCGQSGSGKTYSLGLVLEQLLLETELRIVILDPNSDFVRLGNVRDGADAGLASRYGAMEDVVSRALARTRRALQLAFPELDSATQAAVLRLDPIADREEYGALVGALDEWKPSVLTELEASGGQDGRRLVAPGQESRRARLGLWSRGRRGLDPAEAADPAVRCLVVDLGSLARARSRRSRPRPCSPGCGSAAPTARPS